MCHQADGLLNTILRVAATALMGAGASLLSFAGALAQNEPLVIARQGYFFVGGTIDTSRDGSPTVGHIYEEFQVPQKVGHPDPVVSTNAFRQARPNITAKPDTGTAI